MKPELIIEIIDNGYIYKFKIGRKIVFVKYFKKIINKEETNKFIKEAQEKHKK